MSDARWREWALRFDRWLRAREFGKQVVVLYAIFVATALAANPLKPAIDAVTGVWLVPPSETMTPATLFISAVLVAPLAETWLCQWLILDRLARTRWFVGRPRLVFVLSVLFFGAQHFSSLGYIVCTSVSGVVFAYAFLVTGKGWRGYWATALVHALWNYSVPIINRFG